MSITEKLSYLKRRDHLTLDDIAQRSSIPLGTVNKIFSGQTKNPSASAVYELSKVLKVPVRYLMDDAVPPECSIGTYAEGEGIMPISGREWELLLQYRMLEEHGRRAVDSLMQILVEQAPTAIPNGPERPLVCYQSMAQGQTGSYGDGFYLRPMMAQMDPTVEQADFAVLVSDRSMLPVHTAGTVLAVRKTETRRNQIGVFLVNREGYIRKLQENRNIRKLVGINLDLKDVVLTDRDEVHCLGTVLGAIRNYRWI